MAIAQRGGEHLSTTLLQKRKYLLANYQSQCDSMFTFGLIKSTRHLEQNTFWVSGLFGKLFRCYVISWEKFKTSRPERSRFLLFSSSHRHCLLASRVFCFFFHSICFGSFSFSSPWMRGLRGGIWLVSVNKTFFLNDSIGYSWIGFSFTSSVNFCFFSRWLHNLHPELWAILITSRIGAVCR